jgi:hypothetical protein
MKGIIDKEGNLWILRRNTYKPQFCIYNARFENCCDFCPHFMEPQYLHQLNGKPTGTVILEICEGARLVFHDFVDQREEDK